jgi:predicted Fe-Mo cluster-binding NifX family protein
MKIAVAASGKTLASQVDLRFGRCPYFLIVDSGTNEFEVVENKAGQAARGAGISAAQVIANKGVDAAMAGNFGPNAVNVLASSGIKIFGGVTGITVKEAIDQYRKGKLKEAIAATDSAGMGMGRKMGWGTGRSGGRGWR